MPACRYLLSLVIFSFLFLFILKTPVFAGYLGSGQCDEDAGGGTGPFNVPLSDCQTYGGTGPPPDNICFQVPWTFRYTVCQTFADGDPGADECTDWKYQYITHECNTEDRCWGSSTGASGFDSAGRILPGRCSAESYRPELGPNSACISGGHYKQCCSNPEPGFTPATYCYP